MKRWGKQNPVRFDEKELNTDLGSGNFIFVGSSCDMFNAEIPEEWILKTLKHCEKHNSRYLFQTKNPYRFMDYIDSCIVSDKSVLCTTIETNRSIHRIMRLAPGPSQRAYWLNEITSIDKYVTIEPIIDFDLPDMVSLIKACGTRQVNIGADSGNNNLPEPPWEKVQELITELEKFTLVKLKKNLARLEGKK
jgi:DNA repair photolyase